MKSWQEKLSSNIQTIRIKKKLTVEQLSEQTGLSINKIRNIENGNDELYLFDIEKIADVLNISVTNLFKQAGL